MPWTVVGASGSLATRKSAQARLPARFPNRFRAASSTSAELTSLPPPLPKIPATSDAIEITSVTFQSSGPAGWPSSGYSPGISSGLERISEIRWLIPAT